MLHSSVKSEAKSLRNNRANAKVREGRGGGCPGTEASVEETKLEQICMLQPVEDPTLEMSWRNHGLWRTHTGAGLSWRAAACGKDLHWSREKCEEEGVTDMKCYKPTATHISHLPALLSGEEEVQRSGMKEWCWA